VGRTTSAGSLIGRERELAHVDAALDALGRDDAGCLTFEGEAGIGKTRLLRELVLRSEARGHLVLSGSAAEFERDMPFSVWVDALDAYVASQDLTRHGAFDDSLAGELGAVLPALRGAGAPAGHAGADERYRAHRAVSTLLAILSQDQALVLILDDLHWSDGASIELVVSMLRRWTSASVLLALAFRPAQAPARLTAALVSPAVARMALEPLDEAQAALLLDGVDAASVAAMFRHGGGNPFYLEQLARGLSGPLRSHAAGAFADGVVPAAVAASLADELASLSAPARALLDGAAVAGEPFEPDAAAAIAELVPDAALTALDELLALDLARPTRVPRRFIFRHPLVRRAVYEATPGGWRLAAHARAAAALQAQGAGPVERAHHVEQAAVPGDEVAIELLLAAGEATAPTAPAAAARWFEAALRLLAAGDHARQVDVRVALASAQRSLGELVACRLTLLGAIERVPGAMVARRIELTALCAAVEHWLGRHDDAHRRLVRAWDDLPDHASAEAGVVQIELAVDGMYELDFEQTITMGRGALAIARRLGDGALIAASASALALGEAAAGASADAREHREEAVAQLERLSDAALAAHLEALYYLGWAENYLERYDDAIAHAQRGVAIARATGDGRLLVPMMLVQGYPFEAQGRLAEAIAMCENAVEIARLAAHPHYLFWALFELGWARYFAGDLGGATQACEESLRVGGRMTKGTMPSAGGGPGWGLAVCRFEDGNPAAMLDTMRELGDDELGWAIPVEKCFNWEILALAELALGHPQAAETYAARAQHDAAALDLRLPAALAARTRAAVLLAGGDAPGAVVAARASVDGARAAGAWLQAAFSRGLLGRCLAAGGERALAIAELREAERELDGFGSVRARDEARRELRRLGARAEPRGPATAGESGVAALTKRELQIAGLVTERLTNREIAAKLFLSDKTIESHLRNLFMKLGVSSRTEVARTIERERAAVAAADAGAP
jgi:DNA-binding NarL/FixJ family response regulator/tetratricopeptide (TPR) repeat protein